MFTIDGKLQDCGRIDDWYAEFGTPRPKPTKRDLHVALTAVLAGNPAPPPTRAATQW